MNSLIDEGEFTCGCREIAIIFFASMPRLVNTVFMAFLPLQFKRKGIDGIWYGWVMTIYALSQTIFSLIIGPLMNSFGRSNFLILSLFLLALSSVMTGAATIFVQDNTQYLALILSARVI